MQVSTSEAQGRSTVKTPVSAWRKPGLDLLGDKSLLGQHQQQQIWAQQRLCKHWGAQPRPGWAVGPRTMSLIQEAVSSWCVGCRGASAWLVTQLCLADGAGLYSPGTARFSALGGHLSSPPAPTMSTRGDDRVCVVIESTQVKRRECTDTLLSK